MNSPYAQFLKDRQSTLGGSDVAAVLGLSPWKSPLDVFLSKVEPIAEEPQAINEPAYWGQQLEDIVAREYATREGKRIQRVNKKLVHPQHSWLAGNLDRVACIDGTTVRVGKDGWLTGAEGVIEVKTAGAFAAGGWGRDDDEDAVPVHYTAQAMTYLAITGLPWCDFAVLVGGQKYLTRRIWRDEETIASIIERCEAFWFDHVVARVPPPAFSGDDVLKLFPADTGEVIEANDQAIEAYNKAKDLRAQIKSLSDDLEIETETLKILMAGASGLRLDDKILVSWKKTSDSKKVDWKSAFEKLAHNFLINDDDAKAIVEQFSTEAPGSRRFIVK